MNKGIIIFIFSFLYLGSSSAQLSNDAIISVLTCRPGDSVDNMFGHSAFRIQDPATRMDIVYNYGIFDFDAPNFTLNFLRGKLLYKLGRTSMSNFLRTYQYQNRSVFEQELNLTREERNNIYKFLIENYKPENREYWYEFFFDNCSTKIREILEDYMIGLQFNQVDENQSYTFRQLLDQFNYVSPWTDMGMDLLIGKRTDRIATSSEQMFLPEYLFLNLEKATTEHRPLVSATNMILDKELYAAERKSSPFFTPILFFGLLLLLEIFLFIRKKSTHNVIHMYDKSWFSILAIGGIVLMVMWFLTDHVSTKYNLNLLWMNPLMLALCLGYKRPWNLVLLACLVTALLLSGWIQSLHIGAILMIIITILKIARNHLRPDRV